jgi:hypothetical protein
MNALPTSQDITDADRRYAEALRTKAAKHERAAEALAAQWVLFGHDLQRAIDNLPPLPDHVTYINDCGEDSHHDAEVDHIDPEALLRRLRVVRSHTDALIAAYRRAHAVIQRKHVENLPEFEDPTAPDAPATTDGRRDR